MMQFQGTGTTIANYILGAKSILLYFFGFLLSLYLRKKNKGMYLVSISLLLIMVCRSNPIFLRFSFYFIPFLVYSLDLAYAKHNIGMRTPLSKVIFISIFFLASTMFYWTPAYRLSSERYETLGASDSQVNMLINQKCNLLGKYMPGQVVIFRCI